MYNNITYTIDRKKIVICRRKIKPTRNARSGDKYAYTRTCVCVSARARVYVCEHKKKLLKLDSAAAVCCQSVMFVL